MIALDTSLQYPQRRRPAASRRPSARRPVNGRGPARIAFPTRYEDRGTFQTIASLRPAASASVAGEVISCGIRPTRRPRFKIFEMLVRDRTGVLRAVFFNQPFLNDVFHPHQRVILFGKLELTLARACRCRTRSTRSSSSDARRRGRARVRRRDAAHRTDRPRLRKDRDADHQDAAGDRASRRSASCRRTSRDPLPPDVRARQQLIDRRTALVDVHFPPSRHADRAAQRVSIAGAAAADLRGVLPVSARAGAAPAAVGGGAESRGRSSSPTTSASRRGASCRSSSPAIRRR